MASRRQISNMLKQHRDGYIEMAELLVYLYREQVPVELVRQLRAELDHQTIWTWIRGWWR
jgi:hypothetical protein